MTPEGQARHWGAARRSAQFDLSEPVILKQMSSDRYLHPLADDGTQIRASFWIRVEDGAWSLHFGSRGGTRGGPNETNPDYAAGLRTLLARLARVNATVTEAILDSTRVQNRTREERRLPLDAGWATPLNLRGRDAEAARLALQRAQPGVLRTAGHHDARGNSVRAIRLYFELPDWAPTEFELGHYLVTGRRETEESTDDFDVLVQRASHLRGRGGPPPPGNKSPSFVGSGSARRFQRMPSVVAYVLDRASDACELCHEPSFERDDGTIYLEVHHLMELARGGSDTVQNAVALCAQCHRKLHFGRDRAQLRETLYLRVTGLVRE